MHLIFLRIFYFQDLYKVSSIINVYFKITEFLNIFYILNQGNLTLSGNKLITNFLFMSLR